MKRFLQIALLVGLISAAPASGLPAASATESAQQRRTPPAEIRVWVNTASGVYHCPGTRWYGNTKKGEYMTQAQAKAAGHRAAYGKACA